MTPTAARPTAEQSCHWYYQNGNPCYEVPRATGRGMRPTTLADARKLNLLPSVTTILRVLHKQGLVDWLIEQSCLAVLTTPRPAEEPLDAFVERVLHNERVQDEEAQKARDLGTDIHAALEAYFSGQSRDGKLDEWIIPAAEHVLKVAPKVLYTETILIGYGYAGKCDFIGEGQGIAPGVELLLDFKTTKKLPEKASWPEHRLQLAAYANARSAETNAAITTGNLYISTAEKGAFALHLNPDWKTDYRLGFEPLVDHWRWANNYEP